MRNLLLYHGSNCSFEREKLEKSRNRRDFGKGFYTTTILSQAESWANNMYLRYGGSGIFVYTYELKLSEELKILRFYELNIEWLDFIKDNRMQGGTQHTYDVVWGPVANDNTIRTVNGYMSGIYTAEEALTRLRYFKANDQVSFHTEKALSHLIRQGGRKFG